MVFDAPLQIARVRRRHGAPYVAENGAGAPRKLCSAVQFFETYTEINCSDFSECCGVWQH